MNTKAKELFIAIGISAIIIISYFVVTYVETHDTVKCHYYTDSHCFVQSDTDRVIIAPKDLKKDLTSGDYYVTLDNNGTDGLFEDDTIVKVNRADD